MSRPTQTQVLEWMAYADGELDAERVRAVEQELASNPHAAQMVQEFRALGSRTREHLVQVPDLTDSIMAHLQAAPAHAAPAQVVPTPIAPAQGANVIDLQQARAARQQPAVLAPAAKSRSSRVGVWAAVGSLAVAAAAGALWVGKSLSSAGLPTDFATTALGVHIEQVDSSEQVTVFEIPALKSGASSVVVWLSDDDEDVVQTADPPDAQP